MIGTILGLIFFVIIIGACCCSDSGTSNNHSSPKRNMKTHGGSNTYYNNYSYCECPSCGAPYYDGYCEECGYPDINQGWLGEQ